MIAMQLARRFFLALSISALAFSACAQDKSSVEFQPEVGQAGKDVVWVPTSQALVDKMLDLGKLTARDVHFDLGSGDGRTVITAAKRGANSTGIEYNPDMVALSQRNAAKEGVSARAKFMKADLFETDFSHANLITLFLLPDINLRLRPKILDMKPGTRIVSNSFTMGEWQSDAKAEATSAEGCQTYCTAYLWIVPAKVDGTWKLGDGELTLKQSFQFVTGVLKAGGKETVVKGRLNGDQISFRAGDADYSGRVSGDGMKGSIKGAGGASEWSASRAPRPASKS